MYILILLVLSCGIGTINNRSIEKDYYNNAHSTIFKIIKNSILKGENVDSV